mmetsp:Transcript_8556/g.35232  ORF Transcript_8556/g.35232 Transcript_8556/m.35232 type:complete len:212 (-) Transcript_8556:703-1338(-)
MCSRKKRSRWVSDMCLGAANMELRSNQASPILRSANQCSRRLRMKPRSRVGSETRDARSAAGAHWRPSLWRAATTTCTEKKPSARTLPDSRSPSSRAPPSAAASAASSSRAIVASSTSSNARRAFSRSSSIASESSSSSDSSGSSSRGRLSGPRSSRETLGSYDTSRDLASGTKRSRFELSTTCGCPRPAHHAFQRRSSGVISSQSSRSSR